MAVQPSRNITEILSGALGGRPQAGTQVDRSGPQGGSQRPTRLLPEPEGGYDPKAPRGSYVDITV